MPQIMPPSLDALRSYIGREVSFDGQQCQIIEVLEDGPALVLSCTRNSVIQPNQHGDATRRVPETRTIPILNRERTELHPDYLRLDLKLR